MVTLLLRCTCLSPSASALHKLPQQTAFSHFRSVVKAVLGMSPRRSDANACTSVTSTNYNEGSNEALKSPKCTQPLREERRSCPSIRRVQMERHQMKENMEQLLNTQTRFVKDLEDVLNQHDIAERRKRELLHKHWTERLWLPLQKRLIQRVASCGAAEIKKRQGLYSHYLQHCNSKGHVFLDTYNPKEYDPFLHHLKTSHHLKLAEIEDRPKQAWNPICLYTESKNNSRKFEKLPPHLQSSLVSGSSVRSGTRHGAPSSSSASSSTKTPTENRAAMTITWSCHPFYHSSDSAGNLQSSGPDTSISTSPSNAIGSSARLTQSRKMSMGVTEL